MSDTRKNDATDPIRGVTKMQRALIGIPSRTPDGVASGTVWWEDYEGDELRVELPYSPPGLTPVSSVTAIGLGRVQVAYAYLRPDQTPLVVALEAHEDGRILSAVEADDIRTANAALFALALSWSDIGFQTDCHFGGVDDQQPRDSTGTQVIDLEEERNKRAARRASVARGLVSPAVSADVSQGESRPLSARTPWLGYTGHGQTWLT